MPHTTPQLGLLHAATHQHQPEITRDLAIDGADNATQGLTSHASASDIRISDADFQGYFMHRVTGSPAAAGHLWVPPIQRKFGVHNTTGQNLYVRCVGQTFATTLVLPTATMAVFYCDGTQVLSLSLDTGFPQTQFPSPDVGSLTLTGGLISTGIQIPAGSLTLDTTIPTVLVGANIIFVGAGACSLTGLAPSIQVLSQNLLGVGSLTLSSAPVLAKLNAVIAQVGVGTLTCSSTPPVAGVGIVPTAPQVGTLTLEG